MSPRRQIRPHSLLAGSHLLATSLAGLLAIVPCYLSVTNVCAQSTGQSTGQPASLGAEAANDAINAVLLLDNSGSMLDNDPQRLRDAGARLFMQFLKPGDSLGIISFSDSTEVVRPLSPFTPAAIDTTSIQIGKIDPVGQYTDITNAVSAAQSMLAAGSANGAKNVIIMLSDGKLDPSPRAGRKEALLDQLVLQILPALHEKKIPVYTLAFSGDADKALLGKIAEITDGVNWFTPTSDKIHESFAELFLSVKKPQVAPASERGFKIDPDIEEATFYVNRVPEQDVYLQSPTGRVFSVNTSVPEVRWFQTDKFDVITISKPDAGDWKLSGVSQDDGFATILTNLKLISTFPTTISTHKSVVLQAQLFDSKLPVSIPDMADVVKYAFQISATDKVAEPIIRDFLADSGKDGDDKANDGIFSKKIVLDEEGEYRLRIVAKSPTFERQQVIPFRVRPPAITLEVLSEGEEEHSEEGDVHNEADGHGSDEHGGEEPSKDSHSEDEHGKDEHGDDKHGEDKHADSEHSAPAAQKSPQAKESAPKKDELQSVYGTANIEIHVSESDEFLKNVKVTLTAVDAKKNRFTVPVKASEGHGQGMSYSASVGLLPKDGKYTLTATLQGSTRAGKAVREDSDPVTINRIPPPVTATDIQQEAEPTTTEIVAQQPTVKEIFPLMQLLLAVGGNILIGAIGFVILKVITRKGGSSVSIPPLKPEIESSLLALQKSKENTTLQLEDPRFAEAQGN